MTVFTNSKGESFEIDNYRLENLIEKYDAIYNDMNHPQYLDYAKAEQIADHIRKSYTDEEIAKFEQIIL